MSLDPAALPLELGSVGRPQDVLLGDVDPQEEAAGARHEEDHRRQDGPPRVVANAAPQSVRVQGGPMDWN